MDTPTRPAHPLNPVVPPAQPALSIGQSKAEAATDLLADEQAEDDARVTDDLDLQLLLQTASRHLEVLDPRAVGCLTAAASELLDPLRLPRLFEFDDHETADPVAVAAAVQHRLLDLSRPGTVVQILARGMAARELADAMEILTSPFTAASALPSSSTQPAPLPTAQFSWGSGTPGEPA